MAIESYTPANTEEELAIAEGDVRVNLWKLTKVTIYFWMYMNMWIERHLFAIPAEIMMFSVDAHNYIHSMRACIHTHIHSCTHNYILSMRSCIHTHIHSYTHKYIHSMR